MASNKLYTLPDHFRTYKILFAAALSEYNLELVSTEPDFKLGVTNKSQTFLAKFPLGKVPALEAKDGTCIFESNAIAYYVSNDQLRGIDTKQAALINQWINFADSEILPSACKWVFPTLGLTQYNKQETDAAKDHLKKCLNVLQVYLTSRTFLVGERITLADVVLACNLILMYKQVMDPGFRNPYRNLNRWFETIVNHPDFLKISGGVKLCQKMAQVDHKKYAELHGGSKADQGEKQGQKGGKQTEKSPGKKEKEVKSVNEEDEETPAAPKVVDPLASAPKGTFDFDEFKRTFSNKDCEKEAIPYLWANFDAEHYSIYHAVYKYKEENEETFKSSNKARGLTQRVDALRKHGFAVIYVLGKNHDNNIEGIWIFRGQEVAFTLSPDWNVDAPHYHFHKLDPKQPEDSDKVNSFLLQRSFGSATFPDDDLVASYISFK